METWSEPILDRVLYGFVSFICIKGLVIGELVVKNRV